MENDAVSIPRSIAANVLSCKNRLSKLEAYIYLVLNQSSEPTSLGKLAEAWKWPNSNEVGRFLKQLKADNLIGLEVGRSGTLISVNATPNATFDATLNATSNATPKRQKTKANRKVNATPNATFDATLNATPKDTPDMETKLSENQREKALNERFKVFGKFDYSFIEEHLEDVFFEWLQYKRERKENYKTQSSVKRCYNDIKKFSKNSALTVRKMIEESMRNNWAGIFPLRERSDGLCYGKILHGDRDEIIGNSKGW